MINSTAAKLFDLAAPAAQRNIGPIAEALSTLLPQSGLVLEVATGGGYHSAVLAEAHPHLTWQPSGPDSEARSRIAHMVLQAALTNLRSPLELDAESQTWPIQTAAAILCCNMIHIAPWSAAEGLFAGAGRVLSAGGTLFLYGPFVVDGSHTAPSNESFDQGLRARNPAWGVRDAREVDVLATGAGLVLDQTIDMPANNMIRVYRCPL